MTPPGTGRLVRLALRRDRVKAPLWCGALAVLVWVSALSTLELYPTADQRRMIIVGSARSAVALVFNGLVSGDSPGAVVASQIVLISALAAAFIGTLAAVRHTRAEEQDGRVEMLGATAVGRAAPLAAALVVGVLTEVTLGVLLAGAVLATGLPLGGALIYGAAVAAVGCVFVAVGAVSAQVTTTSRAANGLAAAVIGAAFGLRALGDIAGDVTGDGLRVHPTVATWLSPLGWAELVRPWDLDQWWVLALPLAATATLVAVAAWLRARRDLGAGLLADRAGPARAGRRLVTLPGLTVRLQRGVVIGWVVAVVVLAVSYGAVAPEIEGFTGDSEGTREILEALGGSDRLEEAYLAAVVAIMAFFVTAAVIQLLGRTHGEESGGQLAVVLSAPVGRRRWLGTHLALAAVAGAVLLALSGIGIGAATGAAGGDIWDATRRHLGASLAYLPAVLVVLGVAAVAFAVVPRHSRSVAWTAFVAMLVVFQLGELLDLPRWVRDLSPFTHVPIAPVETVTAAPVVALLSVAAVLVAVALIGFRRRDLAA